MAWSGSLNPVSELPGSHGRNGSGKSFWTDRPGERPWCVCGMRLLGGSSRYRLARSFASRCFQVLPVTLGFGDSPSRSSVSPVEGLLSVLGWAAEPEPGPAGRDFVLRVWLCAHTPCLVGARTEAGVPAW